MKAWRVHEYGVAADVLRLDDMPEPEPGPGQLAVAVEAVGLNFPDLLMAAGLYQEKPPLPFTPGLEVCGRVVAAGPVDETESSNRPSVGDRVLAAPALPAGGMAERALVNAVDSFPVPDGAPATDMAAMLLTYQTAWVGLHRRAALRAGETLLVHAGASGTGSAAIQVGKAIGARVVATAGGEEKAAACRDLGADDVVDYTALHTDGWPGTFVEALRTAVGKGGADVVWDPVGGDVFDASRRCVAFEGRIVVVGFASGRIPDAPTNHLLVKNYSVVGLHWGLYRRYDRGVIDTAQKQIMRGYAEGSLRPLVGSVRPLQEAPAALADLAGRRVLGKAVLTVANS